MEGYGSGEIQIFVDPDPGGSKTSVTCGSGSVQKIVHVLFSKKCSTVIKACFICSRWKFFVQKLKAPCGWGGGGGPSKASYLQKVCEDRMRHKPQFGSQAVPHY